MGASNGASTFKWLHKKDDIVLNNTNEEVVSLPHSVPNFASLKNTREFILVTLLNLVLSNEVVRNKILNDSSRTALTSSKDGEIFYIGDDFRLLLNREFSLVDYKYCLPEKLFHLLTQSSKVCFANSNISFDRVVMGDYMIVSIKNITTADLLSPRHKQVAELFSSGLSYKEIGRILDISPATVRNHIAAIYQVLSVSGRSALKRKLLEC